jgi:hypothetical protein
MTITELGALGEFIGSIAVIATLIYLAVQIRQNTSGMKANAYQMWVSSNLHLNGLIAQQGRPWREGIADSANLDEESEMGFGIVNHSAFQMMQSIDYLYRMGVIDEALWKAEISRAAGHLNSNPGVRQWWDAGGRTQLTPEFVALLESTETDIALWGWDDTRGYHVLDRENADT